MLLSDIFQEMDMRVGASHYVSRHPHDPKTLTVTDKKGRLVPTANARSLTDIVKKSEKIQKKKKRKARA
jgi:hypothetical protein